MQDMANSIMDHELSEDFEKVVVKCVKKSMYMYMYRDDAVWLSANMPIMIIC